MAMQFTRDIRSLTDCKRNTPEFMAQLKQTGQPLILTVNRQAEVIVQDAAAYQELLVRAERDREREETRQAIAESMAQFARGEYRPVDEVFDELDAKIAARGDGP